MSSDIGRLDVELSLNHAKFTEGVNKATREAEIATRNIGKSFSKLGGELSNMFSEFGGQLGGMFNGIAQAGSELFESFSKVGGAGGAAAFAIGGVGVAALAAAAGVAEMAMSSGEMVERLTQMSERTGIGVRDLQAFEAMAKANGLALEDVTGAFRKFDQALTGTGKRAGVASAVLRNLHVTATDNKEAFLQAIDALSKMDNVTQRNADGIALFGKNFINMVPAIEGGREEFEKWLKNVEQFGPVVDKGAVDSTKKWKEATEKLSLAWDALKMHSIGSLGLITKGLDGASSLMKGFGDATREAGEEGWKGWAKLFGAIASGDHTALIGMSIAGGISKSAASTGANSGEDEKRARQKELDESNAKLKEQFELLKAGSAAVYAVEQKRQQLNDAQQAGEYKLAIQYQNELTTLEAIVKRQQEIARIVHEIGAGMLKHPKVVTKHDQGDMTAPAIGGQPEGVDTSAFDARVATLHAADRAVQDFWRSYGNSAKEGEAQINATFQMELSQFWDMLQDKQISQQQYNAISLQLERNRIDALKVMRAQQTEDWAAQAKTFFESWKKEGESFAASFFGDMRQGIDQLNRALVGFMTGQKVSFTAIVKDMGRNMLQSTLKFGESKLLGGLGIGGKDAPKGTRIDPIFTQDASSLPGVGGGLFGGGGDNSDSESGGGIGGVLSKIFGGFLAGGGDVTPGKAYVVGEKHPEFFVPGVSGHVAPMLKTGGESKITNMGGIHFHGVTDADSFKRNQGQVMQSIGFAMSAALARK